MTTQPLVLIVDDEIAILETLKGALQDEGYHIQTLVDGGKVLDAIGKYIPDLVLLDIFLPNHNGIELLENIKKEFPQQQVMMISGFGNIQMALDAVHKGALDFIEKPLSLFDILPKIEFIKKRACRQKQKLAASSATRFGIIGQSFLFKELISHVEQLARLPFPILIYGAPGTGKDLFARYIHSQSAGALSECSIINCNAQTEINYDSFNKPGTIVLADIEELKSTEQKKIAAYISTTPRLRIIATSCKPLVQLTMSGIFNEDLFYKLNIVPVEIPSLEKRKFDIPLLVDLFLAEANIGYAKHIAIAPSGIRFLRNRHWSKNVAELKAYIDAIVAHEQDPYRIIHSDYNPDKIFVTLKTDLAATG
ncbi:MAG: response regulator [Candidatus Babeliales bacterium]